MLEYQHQNNRTNFWAVGLAPGIVMDTPSWGPIGAGCPTRSAQGAKGSVGNGVLYNARDESICGPMGALAFYPYSTPLRGLVRMQHVVEILLSTSRFWKLLKLLELGVETKNAPMTMIHASRNIQQFIFQFE